MTRALCLLPLLIACSGDGTTDTTDTPTDGLPVCGNSLLETFPTDGETDAYNRGVVDFLLAAADSAATISLADGAGADVAGSQVLLGRRVVFTPDVPLTEGETYTGSLNWACDPVETTFTVGNVGAAPIDGATLDGNTYAFSLTEGRIVDPPELKDVLPLMADFDILMTITGTAPDELSFIGGVTDGVTGEQSLCSPSIDFPNPADYTDNPFYIVDADYMEIVVVGDAIPVTDLVLSGTFVGSTMEQVSLTGIIDLGDLCGLLESSGVACNTCPIGGLATCIDLRVDSMTGASFPTAVVPWGPADITANCATR